MMGLYNALAGYDGNAAAILASLNLTPGDVGRFRDAWVDRDEDGAVRFAVYTRNGGGNREEYEGVFDALSRHPRYLFDRDDEFDCTYATIYFSVPDEVREEAEAAAPEKTLTGDDKWAVVLERLRGGAS